MSNVLLQPDTEGTCCGCRPDPCDPCAPPCPEVTLICDSISASKTKCGFSDSGAVWLHKEVNLTGSSSCSGPPSRTASANVTSSADVDPGDCSTTSSCEGGADNDFDPFGGHFTWGLSGGFCGYAGPGIPGGGVEDAVYPLRCFTFVGDTRLIEQTTSHTITRGSGANTASWTVMVSYDDEYTTDQLIDNTIAALPSYFGHLGCEENITIGFRTDGQNCVCFASRNLSSDQTSYSINRFKYAFTFDAQTVAFTLHWIERFTPEGGGSVVDTPRSELITIGATQSSTYTVNEPATDGTISVPTDEVYCS